jgi:hypothetical protein
MSKDGLTPQPIKAAALKHLQINAYIGRKNLVIVEHAARLEIE